MDLLKHTPLVSVVIPLYNKAAYIKKTLQSVLQQSYTNYELILINDGSTDNSLKIAEQVLYNFEFKTIVSQINRGLSATRNRGIQLAKGTIIAFLDADDMWHTDYLETIIKLYSGFPDANIYGTYYSEYYSKNITLHPKVTIDNTLSGTQFLIKDFFEYNLGQPIINPSSIACKRSVFNTLNFNETIDFAEDIDFYIRCFSTHTLAYAYTPKAIVHINVENQMTQLGITTKRIPNFETYMAHTSGKSKLKYLSFMVYNFACQYKYLGDSNNYNKLRLLINKKDLNWKQRLSLQLPRCIYKPIKDLKSFLISKGIKIVTY